VKTAFPFEPLWEARFGAITHRGRGLLDKTCRGIGKAVDCFTVVLPDRKLSVLPPVGEIRDGSTILVKVPPGELRWLRRMQIQMNTQDHNTGAPECLFYFLGIESRGRRVGYEIYADGTVRR
jgi:hypothetical protein